MGFVWVTKNNDVYKMKYIVYKDSVNSSDKIVLFPEIIDHSSMFKNIKSIDTVLVSAGFTYEDDLGQLYCTGHSHTLNVKSRQEIDTIVLKKFLRRY